jgi:tRNA pseudouridine55 synthase
MLKGFLIVDKPQDCTSFDVVAKVRRALGIKRVGHLGTLDPLATGVLVVAVGEGTKLIQYLMGANKVYEGEMEFGKVSDTYDRQGSVIETGGVIPDLESILEKRDAFVGDIQQIPPAFSALKIGGKRAYELARKGKEVNLPPRPATVSAYEIESFESPKATFRIACGSGTYIRSLVHDLGQVLGCGAIMTELRRTQVGEFKIEEAFKDEDYAGHLISLETVVKDWPTFNLEEVQFNELRHGRLFPVPDGFPREESIYPVIGLFNGKLSSLLMVDERGLVKVLKNFVIE